MKYRIQIDKHIVANDLGPVNILVPPSLIGDENLVEMDAEAVFADFRSVNDLSMDER